MEKIILYHSNPLKFGGVDTFDYNFCKKLKDKYDITFLYKEVINKAIKYIETHKRKDEFLELNEWGTRDLLDILKEVD